MLVTSDYAFHGILMEVQLHNENVIILSLIRKEFKWYCPEISQLIVF